MVYIKYVENVKNVSFKCPEGVHAAFKEYAQTQDRTIKSQLIHMMREAVKNEEEKPPDSQ